MEGILRREVALPKSAAKIAAVAVFVLLTFLGAYVRIPLPFTPVPVTMQTMFVLLAGACLGGGLGVASQLSYVLAGTAGGLLSLTGPTAGYLWGFVIASFLVGSYVKRCSRRFISLAGLFLVADLLILACGVAWLKALFGFSLQKTLLLGAFPFIPGDVCKVLAAAIIYRSLSSKK